MLISWLLKYDGYPPGVVVALLLHGLLLWIFMPKDFDPADHVTIQPMSYVVASAVTQSPQQMRRLRQLDAQRQNEEAENNRRRQEQQRQREAETQRQQQAEAERQRQADAERQRVADRQRAADEQREREAEAERQRQAEAERQRQVAEQQRAADAAAQQAAAQQAANNAAQQSVENQLISQYVGIITNLVENAWSRPPGARNGMVATVRLRLTPTGEIVSSDIVRGSGNEEFDRSVLAAVDRVGSFPELKEMPIAIFERSFRTFDLVFSPEDLLR